jgi:hypothetical protein
VLVKLTRIVSWAWVKIGVGSSFLIIPIIFYRYKLNKQHFNLSNQYLIFYTGVINQNIQTTVRFFQIACKFVYTFLVRNIQLMEFYILIIIEFVDRFLSEFFVSSFLEFINPKIKCVLILF